MKRIIFVILIALVFASTQFAQTAPSAPDAAEITKLLHDFMANGATRNDYDWHDKFWAEDVIYTRAAGVRTTKTEIMRGRDANKTVDQRNRDDIAQRQKIANDNERELQRKLDELREDKKRLEAKTGASAAELAEIESQIRSVQESITVNRHNLQGDLNSMRNMASEQRPAAPPTTAAPAAVFTAEDIRIQQYGTTAIVAFQLVAKMIDGSEMGVSKYLNTATMLKRDGKWQVAGYQVTSAPRAEEDSKKEALAVEAAFWKAVSANDGAGLKKVTDDKFVWVHHTGAQDTAQKFLDDVTTGKLKYAKLTTKDMTVTVSGDTAIVRGTSDRQREGQTQFTTFYTLIFVNRGGTWKAISLHTSRVV